MMSLCWAGRTRSPPGLGGSSGVRRAGPEVAVDAAGGLGWSRRARSCAGIIAWSPRSGRLRTVSGVCLSVTLWPCWRSAWLGRITAGGTSESRVSFSSSVTAWKRQRSAAFSRWLWIPPGEHGGIDTTWWQFLRAPASMMVVCDVFPVQGAGRLNGFTCFSVGGRQPVGAPAGRDHESQGRWTTQQVRNLVMALGDRLTQFWFLVCDRAGEFTASFDAVLAAGIQVADSLRYPRAHCFAERFVGTLRTELTDRALIFSEHHLPTVLGKYVRPYSGRRPHRACDLRPPQRPTPDRSAPMNGSSVG
jgi:hypothetical protein